MAAPALRRVVEELNKLIVTKKKEMQQEVALKDLCTEEQHGSEVHLSDIAHRQTELTQETGFEQQKVESAHVQMEESQKRVHELEVVEMEKVKKIRAEERSEYNAKVKNHQDSMNLLDDAINVLKLFYERDERTTREEELTQQKKQEQQQLFLQQKTLLLHEDEQKKKQKNNINKNQQQQRTLNIKDNRQMAMQTPPAAESSSRRVGVEPKPQPVAREYEQSRGGKGVVALLTQLRENVASKIQGDVDQEAKNQRQYEMRVNGIMSSVQKVKRELLTLENDMGKADTRLKDFEDATDILMSEEEEAFEYRALVQKKCGFLVANFGQRMESRRTEVENLQHATHVLAGAH